MYVSVYFCKAVKGERQTDFLVYISDKRFDVVHVLYLCRAALYVMFYTSLNQDLL